MERSDKNLHVSIDSEQGLPDVCRPKNPKFGNFEMPLNGTFRNVLWPIGFLNYTLVYFTAKMYILKAFGISPPPFWYVAPTKNLANLLRTPHDLRKIYVLASCLDLK
jgi:hypothetical protein